MRLYLVLLILSFILANCNLNTRYQIGDVYSYQSEKGSTYLAKVIDINKDRVFLCIYTDVSAVNKLDGGSCLDYGLDYQNAHMTEDEKNDSLHSFMRYNVRLPKAPTSRYNSMKSTEFSDMRPTFMKSVEPTATDTKTAEKYWNRYTEN